ncbi:MAG: nickel pincer cofactor biosynthesis protein LarC [Candidatus Bipolaricaulota bacterium]|nr:nickel pincer cofactor biosynthesis protein LarC [Candidatus Bipolaricaulota bacterium]MCS7274863.1 nickel pincer cofactor biosynthesis protein LarC [Candidatus Bipolaricaulota bacterium]MDW8111142.1 nickel pincer cofactor biosynthesis protein LarC [Candidatus Bipolaricaulota bacterium]MDW8329598.1 nickel pincer cofactor biosynthesis protein LarC [Candidatus Bipolaricaulota bacterium]
MKIAYLDCFSGIAGDMFLAALLDAELIAAQFLSEKLSRLGLGPVRVHTERVLRQGIAATHLRFETSADSHDHQHWSEIRALIEKSALTASEKARAMAIFSTLADAEAKIHGIPIDNVHFHELGALDSIFDIVGAAIAIEALRIDRWYASRVNVGSGTVETAHGRLPVPAPATLELLRGFPIYSSGIETELVTPTGAAILKALAPGFAMPTARPSQIGYGAGTKDLSQQPNVLRLVVGDSDIALESDETIVIETEIDDMNPELFPYVQQKLLQHGAKSVSAQNILMKKGRPGLLVRVLCDAVLVDKLCELLFRETTTLGAIYYPVQRKKLARKIIEVETPYGRVRVKVGMLGSEVINIAPEHEDCKKLADEKRVALKEIYRAATEAASRQPL